MTFFDEGRKGATFEDGIEFALRFILASPQFLVRAEREPATARAGQTYRITDLELASRLSFFLWSSIPDDELIAVAGQGRLSQPRVLEQQVRRMLADPRSEALVTNFAQQLLYLRNLPATSPDGIFYPNWDDELRQSLQRESELFFESIIREDRSILDLLTADYTFVNERLARHYGIPNVYGIALPARDAAAGDGLPARAARQGQLPRRDVDAELPHLAGQARRVGAGEHPRDAAAGAAGERPGARGDQERRRQGADAARADDAAPRRVRRAPAATGSWTRSASRSRTSTPTRAGVRSRAARAACRSMRR